MTTDSIQTSPLRSPSSSRAGSSGRSGSGIARCSPSPAAGSACATRDRDQWGMLRLTPSAAGRARTRVAIVGFIEDGPNLVTPAMNGWADPEPAWWLNLQANPEATVELPDGVAPGRRASRRPARSGRALGALPGPRLVGLHRRQRRPPVTRDRARGPRAAASLKSPGGTGLRYGLQVERWQVGSESSR